jgi:ferredoxin/flavodoxin---NADP+ reductase
MYKIIVKQELAPKIKLFEVEAPQVAIKSKPGQFVILRINEEGERFTLTLVSADKAKGTVRFAFHEVGKSTKELGTLNKGDSILDLVGPLGKPSEIEKFGKVLCVGGGVMVAPLHFVATALREAGNELIIAIGARNKGLLIFENEMKSLSKNFSIITDDGSKGYKEFNFLKEILDKEKIDRVVTMGPVTMMKTVSELSKPYNIKTMVTLTPIMVDGTGMCGCCRVGIGTETKFACVDGPEFDGHQVDWELLSSRQRIYLPEERISFMSCKCGKK